MNPRETTTEGTRNRERSRRDRAAVRGRPARGRDRPDRLGPGAASIRGRGRSRSRGSDAGDHPNVIEVRPSRGANGRGYVRVGAGDVVAEGDRGPGPGAIDQWRVTAVTPDLVAGRDRRTGASVAWDRDWLERQLRTGGMSTGLSEFVRVAVTPVRTVPGRPADPPGVRAVAYGDDGRRYGRVYRWVDDARGSTVGGDGPPDSPGPSLEPVWEDRATARLPSRHRVLLDHRVRAALVDAGYRVGVD